MGIATSLALYKDLNFDARTDLEPIALAGDVPMILVRNKNFEPSSVSELIDFAKKNPGKVNFSNAGVGRSEEHTSELQSLMRISYDVFCLKKKKQPSKNARDTCA